jgi:hypothetical protein
MNTGSTYAGGLAAAVAQRRLARTMAGTPLERARKAVRAHAPELLDAEIVELGRGLDNTTFTVVI